MSFRLQTLIIVFIAVALVALLVIPGRIPKKKTDNGQNLFSSNKETIDPEDSGGVPLNDIVSGLDREFDAEFQQAQDAGFETDELVDDIEKEAGDYGQPINANDL